VPIESPLWKASEYPPVHVQVPVLRKRHVFWMCLPGLIKVPSGSEISATKAARSSHCFVGVGLDVSVGTTSVCTAVGSNVGPAVPGFCVGGTNSGVLGCRGVTVGVFAGGSVIAGWPEGSERVSVGSDALHADNSAMRIMKDNRGILLLRFFTPALSSSPFPLNACEKLSVFNVNEVHILTGLLRPL
jgi:hypothetical protein